MIEYAFYEIERKGFVKFKIEPPRKIIDDFAKRGYRYVGFVPTEFDNSYCSLKKFDLIFEKEKTENN